VALTRALGLLVAIAAGCGRADLRRSSLDNRIAYIPAACFTRVGPAADGGREINPCYVCHGQGTPPNHEDQLELQRRYDFPQVRGGREVENPWLNLFVDRRAALRAIDDAQVRAYVARDNYQRAGENLLAAQLGRLPASWDVDGDGRWGGYRPDAYFAFDADGWDRAPDGSASGWYAFTYAPLPGAFMPTNGSFDDVLIRLPEEFRRDARGHDDLRVYAMNLALLEAAIIRREGSTEAAAGVAGQVRPPLRFVGAAAAVPVVPGLYPAGTEFLHSVRYLAVAADGGVVPSARMKELRYSRKQRMLSYSELRQRALRKQKETDLDPDRPEQFAGDAEHGVVGDLGWVYQGFIEDSRGELRPQSYEEMVSCMGCHTGLPATTDGSFAFPRKRAAAHDAEYPSYLRRSPTGDPYRSNREVAQMFSSTGRVVALPTPGRALALDKAYWLIVREQSFVLGRDALLEPAANVLREVRSGAPTGITQSIGTSPPP
jgi:hypothetical protein